MPDSDYEGTWTAKKGFVSRDTSSRVPGRVHFVPIADGVEHTHVEHAPQEMAGDAPSEQLGA